MLHTLFIVLLLSSFTALAVVDNSFLLEEAYQQPSGTYQFIQTYQTAFKKGSGYDYGFALEAPITDLVHQFSFSGTRSRSEDVSHGSMSDITINYRYQPYNRDGKLVTERFGLILPTGRVDQGSGRGVLGFEFMQAATIIFSERWANHWNLGVSLFPRAKFSDTQKRTTLTEVKAGTSWVYFLQDDINLMMELFLETEQTLNEDNEQETEMSVTLSPGIRFGKSYDWKEMEVVPGFGFPVQFAESNTDVGMILYLSFEPKLH